MLGGRVLGGAAGAVTGTAAGKIAGDPLVGAAVGSQMGMYAGAKYGRMAAEQMADAITKDSSEQRGKSLLARGPVAPMLRHEL